MNKCKNIECYNLVTKNNNLYCSSKCRNVYVNKYLRDYSKNAESVKHKYLDAYNKDPKQCLNCNAIIPYEKRENSKFCNHSCSASYNNVIRGGRSIKTKKKISDSIKLKGNEIRKVNKLKYDANPKLCCICNIPIKYKRRGADTCADECYRKLLSIKIRLNPNCGGETNYRKFRYKNIWMDSTWELLLAEWLDSKNIQWVRSRKIFFVYGCDKKKYFPDFYLPKYNVYIDTKNDYLLKKDDLKLKSVISEHNIELIVGNLDIVKNEITKKVIEFSSK